MQPIEYSQSFPATIKREEAIRDLRFLGGALQGEADEVQYGKLANRQPLVLAGWTIYCAGKSGLLQSVVDLEKAIDAFYLRSMDSGVPLLLGDRQDNSSIPTIVRDVGGTIEQFIQQVEAKLEREQERIQSSGDVDKPALHLDLEPDTAAQSVVILLWDYLTAGHREELPDQLKLIYLNDHPLSRLTPDSSTGLRKAAWVCQFLADKIGQQWDLISIADAAKQYDVKHKSTISRACQSETNPDGPIKTNGKSRRELLMIRKSFLLWLPGYRTREAKRQEVERTQIRYSYECSNPDCNLNWLKKVDKPPKKCPKCSGETRPIPGAAAGTQRPRN